MRTNPIARLLIVFIQMLPFLTPDTHAREFTLTVMKLVLEGSCNVQHEQTDHDPTANRVGPDEVIVDLLLNGFGQYGLPARSPARSSSPQTLAPAPGFGGCAEIIDQPVSGIAIIMKYRIEWATCAVRSSHFFVPAEKSGGV